MLQYAARTIFSQVGHQFTDMWRRGSKASHAKRQVTHGPTVGQRNNAECRPATPTPRRRLRNDCKTSARFDHPADNVEAAQPHANLQLLSQTLGLAIHK